MPTSAVAVRQYMQQATGEDATHWVPQVSHWARLRLPTGQIARSTWKEKLKPVEKVRMSCNIRVRARDNWVSHINLFTQYQLNETIFYGEVQFFFQATIHDHTRTLALVSNYSLPDLDLLRQSYETLWTCRYQGTDDLCVVDVKNIHSVVAIMPFPFERDKVFVGKKIGLEVAALGGIEEEDDA